MNRYGAVFWLILVLVAGFATFKAKYAIQDLEDELAKVRKQTVAEQQEIRVLTAEWTYLNQPERLADLNKHFLNLAPVAAKQLQQRIEDIPLRTPPAVAPAPENPDQLVASTTERTSTQTAPASVATAVLVPGPATAPAPTPAPEASSPVAARSPAAVAAAILAPISPAAAAPAPVKGAATTVATPAARPVPHVQLAKAGPASLDALIAKIAEVH